MVEALGYVGLIALLVITAVITTRYQIVGVCLLAATAPLQGILYVRFYGLDVRPYEMVLIGLIGGLVMSSRLPRMDWIGLAAVLYAASGFLSLNVSVNKRNTLTTIFFEFVMVAILLAVRTALRSGHELRVAVLFWTLAVGNAVACVGLIQFVVYYLGFHIYYFSPQFYTIFRPYSTFTEPDLLANFIVSTTTMAVALVTSPYFGRWRLALAISIVLQIVVLALSEARAAWIGLLIAVFVFAVLHIIRTRRIAVAVATVGSLVVGTAMLAILLKLASPHTFDALAVRVQQTFDPLSEGAARARLGDLQASIWWWRQHPIFGNGVGTWGQVFSGLTGRDARVPPRNLEISVLYEKGIVGAFVAVGLYAYLLFSAGRTYFSRIEGTSRSLALALLVAVIAVLVSFQFTRIDIAPEYWFTLGLLAVAGDLRMSGPSSGGQGEGVKSYIRLGPATATPPTK